MCRWMAWFGQPVLIEELLFNTTHGIVDQSLHARMGAEPTNGDGFGLGWYGTRPEPALYRSVAPAWADPNLRELASAQPSNLAFCAANSSSVRTPCSWSSPSCLSCSIGSGAAATGAACGACS
jgi:predicted glutamine amidotransferase